MAETGNTPNVDRPKEKGRGHRLLPVWEFSIHSFLGTLIFLLIFVPAVLLNLLMHACARRYEISKWLEYAASGAEIMLVAAAIILLAVFLMRTGWRAAKEF